MKICFEDVDIMKKNKKCAKMYYCSHFSLALNFFIFLRQELKKIKKTNEKRETHVQTKCTSYQSTKDPWICKDEYIKKAQYASMNRVYRV